jgi:hypothetical protein
LDVRLRLPGSDVAEGEGDDIVCSVCVL